MRFQDEKPSGSLVLQPPLEIDLTTWTSRALAVAALSLGAAAAPAAHAVTALNSWLVTEPEVELEGMEIFGISPHPTEYSLGAPASLATTATLAYSLIGGLGTLQTHAEGTATTTSAASGTVDFRGNYQIALLNPALQIYLPVGYSLNSGWQYQFTPTTNARLTIDYDVDAGVLFGPSFGGWNIRLDQDAGIGATSFVNGVGSYTADLVAGAFYQLTLFSPGLTTFDTAVLAAGAETANFTWNIAEQVITPVPEPSTWMLTAAGLVAFVARRRRAVALRALA